MPCLRDDYAAPAIDCAKPYPLAALKHVKRPIFHSIVETACDHHGYITTLQVREAGIDSTQLRRLAGRAVLSHESALVLLGLSDVNPSLDHLTASPDNDPRAKGSGPVRIHRGDLPANDVTLVDDLPVTTVACTIVDCHKMGTDPAQLRLAMRQARQSRFPLVDDRH